MNPSPKKPILAIVEQNTFTALGLKSLIRCVAPQVDIHIYNSTEALEAERENVAIMHYFVNQDVLLQNLNHFLPRKRQIIVLVNGSCPEPLADFHHIDANSGEEALTRAILMMMQRPHAQGHNLPTGKPSTPNKPLLSKRETEVLSLVAKGFINKEIADQLCISLTTVISHRKNITDKLHIRNVSGLTIYAVTHGYVNINEIL